MGPHRVDVKQAISMIVAAWSDVTQTTIKNCWRHTGIMHTPPTILPSSDLSDSVTSCDDPEDDLPLSELRQLMRELSPESELSAADYIDIDQNEQWAAPIDLDEIIASVTDSPEDQEEEEDPISEPPVTDREGLQSLQTFLKHFMSNMSSSVQDASTLTNLLTY